MRDYFEEMNIDYNELKKYEDIETYYDEVQDYTKLIKELQCDRVEALKQIVNKNKEIERLNKELKFHKRNEKILIDCQNDVTEKLEELKTELQQKENIMEELKERSLQYSEEIDRLLDIINELENHLEKIIINGGTRGSMTFWYRQIYDYLQELKGSDKE